MALYFFDSYEGDKHLADELGTICANDLSAIAHARRALAAVVGDPTSILPWQRADIIVRRADGDETGRISMIVEVETRYQSTAAKLGGVEGERKNVSPANLGETTRISAEGR